MAKLFKIMLRSQSWEIAVIHTNNSLYWCNPLKTSRKEGQSSMRMAFVKSITKPESQGTTPDSLVAWLKGQYLRYLFRSCSDKPMRSLSEVHTFSTTSPVYVWEIVQRIICQRCERILYIMVWFWIRNFIMICPFRCTWSANIKISRRMAMN